MIKVLILKHDSKVLISEIREVGAEVGEPDCELTNPVEFVIDESKDWKERLQRWPGQQVTHENKCMMSSDAILTIVDPHKELLDAYKEVITA
tara:strand:+ start:508 stop:783 length:276 start_codon:yes stop_codon:yes gene_type:complete